MWQRQDTILADTEKKLPSLFKRQVQTFKDMSARGVAGRLWCQQKRELKKGGQRARKLVVPDLTVFFSILLDMSCLSHQYSIQRN